MMTKIDDIKETFSLLDNWEDRYAYLIDLGRKLDDFPDHLKNDNHIVKGCTSQVWMVLDKNDERITIKATSDAHIVRGLIAILIALYDGQPISNLTDINAENVFSELGLSDHLSPNRRNGFFAMVERIKSVKF